MIVLVLGSARLPLTLAARGVFARWPDYFSTREGPCIMVALLKVKSTTNIQVAMLALCVAVCMAQAAVAEALPGSPRRSLTLPGTPWLSLATPSSPHGLANPIDSWADSHVKPDLHC